MEEFNDEFYYERKEYWKTQFQELLNTVDGDSVEDQDAFWNAMEDFVD